MKSPLWGGFRSHLPHCGKRFCVMVFLSFFSCFVYAFAFTKHKTGACDNLSLKVLQICPLIFQVQVFQEESTFDSYLEKYQCRYHLHHDHTWGAMTRPSRRSEKILRKANVFPPLLLIISLSMFQVSSTIE